MKTNIPTEKLYRLSSFYPASFLHSKGLQLVGIEKISNNRSSFVFVDVPERENLLHSYKFAPKGAASVLVDSRSFVESIKSLKEMLYHE
jgi:hypothetical protein